MAGIGHDKFQFGIRTHTCIFRMLDKPSQLRENICFLSILFLHKLLNFSDYVASTVGSLEMEDSVVLTVLGTV